MLLKKIQTLIFGILALAGCSTGAPLPSGNAGYDVNQGMQYLLGPGDKVRVVVFNDPALSGEFVVGNSGTIALPLVGEIRAGGLTPADFQSALRAGIMQSGMVRDPKVSIDIVEYRPYFILGEVQSPGKYPYTVGLTLTKAVATAGGFTYRADNKVVYITREGQTVETAEPVTAATWIGAGDTVRIGERHF